MKAMAWLRISLVSLVLLPLMALRAAEVPVVQVQVQPETVTVGEPVTLRVSVFAPTWFPQPPVFPSFELPNTITRLPPDSSGPVTRRVGRSTWSGVQRRYQVFPLVDGQFQIGERSVTVTYADPESRAPISLEIPVPDIVFNAEVPPGADSLDPYLAGRSLTLNREYDADLSELVAGDALVIRYRATLEGLPSLFLPPLFALSDQPGLSVYPEEPELRDEPDRAVREETVTLVFDSGGEFSLPPLELRWWNLRTGAIEVARIDGMNLSVAGSVLTPLETDRMTPSGIGVWLLLAGVLAVSVYLLRGSAQKLLKARRIAHARYLESEACCFKQLEQALLQRDRAQAYNRLLDWLWRIDSSLELDAFCSRYGDETLTDQLKLLRESRFGSREAGEADYQRLTDALGRARDRFRRHLDSERQVPLPGLNP